MKAILIAAGMGRRLSPYTDDRPKCMVEVAGKPLIRRTIDTLRGVGVTDFVVIHGYRGDVLTAALKDEPGVRFVENPNYQRNNILLSLMCAKHELEGGFFCTYGDIVFRPEIAATLARSTYDLSLVVDPFWADAYDGRTEHPVGEAELCGTEKGLISHVGKRSITPDRARGEFIGLWRASAAGARAIKDRFEQRLAELGLDAPYGRAPRLEVAYLTDLFADLIASGQEFHTVDIGAPRSWREIDTVQDLERAAAVVDW